MSFVFTEQQVVSKLKVKLSLCLTKHHTMKTYWRSGGIAACCDVFPTEMFYACFIIQNHDF